MSSRTRAQSITDELAFPLRVVFRVRPFGLGKLYDQMHAWLADELGRGHYASHGATAMGGDVAAVYFRTTEDTQRFVASFPDLELADSTVSPAYSAAARLGSPDVRGCRFMASPARWRSTRSNPSLANRWRRSVAVRQVPSCRSWKARPSVAMLVCFMGRPYSTREPPTET